MQIYNKNFLLYNDTPIVCDLKEIESFNLGPMMFFFSVPARLLIRWGLSLQVNIPAGTTDVT